MRVWTLGIVVVGLLMSGTGFAAEPLATIRPKDTGPHIFRYMLTFSGKATPDKAGTHFDVSSSAKLSRNFDRTIADGQDTASFHSSVTLRKKQPSSFYEKGTITFGSGTLMFTSVAPGTMSSSPAPGMNYGHVVWQVSGGTGTFAGASGYIASVFTSKEDGSLSDSHAGVIFLK